MLLAVTLDVVQSQLQKRSSLEQTHKPDLKRLLGGGRERRRIATLGHVVAELLLHLLFDQLVHVHLKMCE